MVFFATLVCFLTRCAGRYVRLLEAPSLIDDVFVSAPADKINSAAADVLAHAAAASHPPRQSVRASCSSIGRNHACMSSLVVRLLLAVLDLKRVFMSSPVEASMIAWTNFTTDT